MEKITITVEHIIDSAVMIAIFALSLEGHSQWAMTKEDVITAITSLRNNFEAEEEFECCHLCKLAEEQVNSPDFFLASYLGAN
jgi:hypothetical protein